MVTRTHVHYFTEESLAPLREALAELERDFAHRRPHMEEEAADALERRLCVVDAGLSMLGEPAPGPFGG